MKYNYKGALPSQHITSLVNNKFITINDHASIKPASLDLSITDEVFEIPGAFQVPQHTSVWDVLKQIPKRKKVSLDEPLLVGKHYIARIQEKLDLKDEIYGYANPKSTTGRLDIHARLMADGVPQNDTVSSGFSGDLWVHIKPQSFSTKLYPGTSLNQIRLFYSDTRLDKKQLEEIMQKEGLLYTPEGTKIRYKDMQVKDSPDSIVLRLDGKTGPKGEYIGYRTKKTSEIIDYNKKYNISDFFDPIIPDKNGLIFLPTNCFSILSCIEYVSVPGNLACEMASIDDRFGELRSHYAGFIDPGWGWMIDDSVLGRPLTLEVRPFENVFVRHGQPIARIKFEQLAEMPDMTYDTIASNYTNQSKAKLAKQFA